MGLLSWLFGRKQEAPEPKDKLQPLVFETPRPARHNAISSGTPKARVRWREGSFPMEVVGESNYQPALIGICGPHSRYGHDQKHAAVIELEPSNAHDPNAVVVKILGRVVGYLPREQALRVGSQMREEDLTAADCVARVQGGWRTNQHDEGDFGVRLAIPQWDWIDFGIGRMPPATSRGKSTRPEPARSGPLVGEWVAIIGAPSDGELANELAGKGAHIMAGVGKSTSLVVVAHERPFESNVMNSTRYRKAEERLGEGGNLRIVSLSEARHLMAL